MPVRIKRNVNQARTHLLALQRAQAHGFKRVAAVAMHQDVGGCEQTLPVLAVARIAQVEPGAALAQCHLRRQAWFVPPRRIDTQDFSAGAGQHARTSRTSEHSRHIQHAQSGKWSRCVDLPSTVPGWRALLPMDQRFCEHGNSLQVLLPCWP